MQLTIERQRTRWIGLFCVWSIIAVLLYLHAAAFREYIGNLDGAALRGAPVATTPLRRICPTMYADAQMWVRHALALADGAGPQMRFTHVDNAPFGREIHWDSGFAWLIVFAGWLRHIFTGESFSVAVEQSLAWFNLPLLLGFVVIISVWVSRRAGLAAGAFLAFAMVGDGDFFSGFSPNYVDHHGVLAVAVLGLTLGAMFMGVGFWRSSDDAAQLLPQSLADARRAAVFSAVFGAIGMWFSAATLIPAIAIVGFAGAATMIVFGRRVARGAIHLEPSVWRLWGSVGAWMSLGFYLLEYAPFHLGFRLEVNHPAYAAGWWGGSEIIAQIAEWQAARVGVWRPRWGRFALAAAAMVVTPIIIAIGGERVFVVFDPFITRLSRHVAEGISTIKAVEYFGPSRLWVEGPWTGASLLVALVAWWRCRLADRVLLAFGGMVTVAATAMAVAQIRWWPSAGGPQMCLVLIALAALVRGTARWIQWGAVLAAIALLCLPDPISRIHIQRESNRARAVDKADAFQPLYRDVAATLRASQPEGTIVVLASPNGSAAIGYYGQFQTIGTLYWENLAGTKAAAEIFSARSEDEARRLVRERGITHIAMISQDNFLAEYLDLLHPDAGADILRQTFGYQLLVDQKVPLWLENIPYQIPADLPVKPNRVLLFKTHFGSTAAEAAYDAARADFAANRMDDGEKNLDRALALAPTSSEFWVTKSNLRLSRGDANGAFAAANKAVDTCPEVQRSLLCTMEANTFYQRRAQVAAAMLYRRSLELRFDPATANNYVWVLATSTNDKLRNGPEALRIAEQLAPKYQDHTFLNAYAAALAECGRYADAVTVATRALEGAQATKDANLVALANARLEKYRAGQPWRE
jgi:tetratricopeptide (TPR) repeat protein